MKYHTILYHSRRYDVAEGIRVYAQESWKLIVNDTGKNLVQNNINAIVCMMHVCMYVR